MIEEKDYLRAVSVTGLTEYLQELIEEDEQLRQVWVIGEVSSLKDHPSGLFFTLQDPDGEATIQCVVWRSQIAKLVQSPKLGEQVLVLGSIRLYAKRGDYKLIIYQCLAVGEGLQAFKLQQLRSRLQAEGLFDLSRKRPLPTFPQTLAVVTSPTAAAWGDIQRTLRQRYPSLTLLLSPAIVQGEKAPNSIALAIQRVNRDKRAEIIILARGGGAVEDLSCFNDERVVRAIAESKIPVITGIGHERDESLADLVADASFHTPTAAAQNAVPDYYQLVPNLIADRERLKNALQWRLQREKEQLEGLKTRLKQLPTTAKPLIQATHRYQLLSQKLLALDPQGVLKRGYVVLKNPEGSIIDSINKIESEQVLTVQLKDGTIKVKVIQ